MRSLGAERLLSVASVAAGDSEGLDAARSATDETLSRLRPALGSAALSGGFGERLEEARASLDAMDELRATVDLDRADAGAVIDGYSTVIDELLQLEGAVATTTSAADLSLALGSTNILSQAQEARSKLTAEGAKAIGQASFEDGSLELLTSLRDEQTSAIDQFLKGASPSAAAQLTEALSAPSVASADAEMDELISDATIGGPGAPQIDLTSWIAGQSAWLDSVGAVDQSLVRDISAAAGDSAYSATQSARLFMLVTAGATLLSILLAVWVARSIDRPLKRLTTAANELASDRLPRLVENLRSPEAVAVDVEDLDPIEVQSSDEIGQVTEAFNAIQQVTVNVAEEQSSLLRKGIGDIFVNLARRNQSLLDRQIEFIDELESKEQDPDLLENLFRLDHLATRMRRNAESLLVLAGAEPTRRRAKPVALADVVRVAIGEVEDFTRVGLHDLDEAIVAGNLAVDLSHLLSELMENATHFSPPETAVEVGGQFGPGGAYVLTVTDHGIGMSGDDLAQANELLANPPLVGLALGRSLGFIVVGRIAARLGLRVHLNASPAGGVTAVIELTPDLVARPGQAEPRDPLIDRPATEAPADARAEPERLAPSGSDGPTTDPIPPPPAPPPPPERDEPAVGPAPAAIEAPSFLDDHPSVDDIGIEPPSAPLSPGAEPQPMPSRAPKSASGQLADALPRGDEFEEGLAALVGPESAGGDAGGRFERDRPDADPPNQVAGTEADDPFPALPDPETVFAVDEGGAKGLVRRVPGAAGSPSPVAAPSVAAPRRSPEQVRAMLSRYRDGRKGLNGPVGAADDGHDKEDVR